MDTSPPLLELLGDERDEDHVYETFVTWAESQGLTLYPAQSEAALEIVTGSNVILATPTGSGKSLVAVAAHLTAMADGRRSFYPHVEIVFAVERTDEHYHVPLLLSPFGYSTYRGS